MLKAALASLTCVLTVAAFPAPSAEAVPGNTGGYPKFTYEGLYPDKTPCRYRLQQVRKHSWKLRTITLKYFYSPRCGSFARIDNAPPECVVYLSRTRAPGAGDRITSATVWETVDPGIDFAYTKVANNLGRRESKASLACGGGPVLSSTTWY